MHTEPKHNAEDHRSVPWIYGLVAGLLGWAILLIYCLTEPEPPPLLSVLFFVLFSTLTKQLGFQAVGNLTHSLVGVVDLAALFSLGKGWGALVAATSAALCQLVWAFAKPASIQKPADRNWSRWFLALFGSGLNALMAMAAGTVFLSLGGPIPLGSVSWDMVPAVLAACMIWFATDHLGWALAELLRSGPGQFMAFLRSTILYSLLVELTPLPVAALLSVAYLSLTPPLVVLAMLATIGVGLMFRMLMVSLAEERQHVRELTAIAQVSRQVAAIQDLPTLFADSVRLVSETFGYYHVSIYSVDAERGEVSFLASSSPEIQKRGISVPWGEGIIGQAAKTGEALLANDVRREERYLPETGLERTRSELAVPLRVDTAVCEVGSPADQCGRVVGVLDVQSDAAGAFSRHDILVLQSLADQIAIAMENSRLYQVEQQQAWVSTSLLQVAEAIAELNTPQDILAAVVRLAPFLTGVERCYVFLWSPEQGSFAAVESAGLSPAQFSALQGVAFSTGAVPLLDEVLREGLVRRCRSEELLAFLPSVLSADPRRGVLWALPLRSKGKVVGVMVAEDLDVDGRQAAHRQAILTGIAHYAAMGLENARLYVAQREEAWVSSALLQVANDISRSHGLRAVVSAVTRMTPAMTGVTWCAVLLWDREQQSFHVAQSEGAAGVAALSEGRRHERNDHPLLDRLISGAEPIVSLREEDSDPWGLGPDTGEAVAVAMRGRDHLLGALLAGGDSGPEISADRRRGLLTGIGQQLSVAIEAAQLYEQSLRQDRLQHEMELARNIQESFMPDRCPQIPGWQLVAEWQAASSIGGDYYDFIELDAGRLGLLIADVSDKGVAAALYMALTRTLMRVAALGAHGPAEALSQVNRFLLDEARSGMFVSIFYAVLDLESGHLTCARAGHNPPLLVSAADRTLIELVPPGTILGIVDAPYLGEESLTLSPGDLLVMYTDGVTEAINEQDEEFGEERLKEIVAQSVDDEAETLANRITSAVRDHRGPRPPFDDLTLVVLKRQR